MKFEIVNTSEKLLIVSTGAKQKRLQEEFGENEIAGSEKVKTNVFEVMFTDQDKTCGEETSELTATKRRSVSSAPFPDTSNTNPREVETKKLDVPKILIASSSLSKMSEQSTLPLMEAW